MAGFNIDANQFRIGADAFAAQLVDGGIGGAGTGRYYLMPAALPFLSKAARELTELAASPVPYFCMLAGVPFNIVMPCLLMAILGAAAWRELKFTLAPADLYQK